MKNSMASVLDVAQYILDAEAEDSEMTQVPEIRVDQFSFFAGVLILRGWACENGVPFARIALRIGAFMIPIQIGLPSLDAPAKNAGFLFRGTIPFVAGTFQDPEMVLSRADGSLTVISNIGVPDILTDRGHQLYGSFLSHLKAMPVGHFLEIGSRARSGITRRGDMPPGWKYCGFDIVSGENVDVVGDAHTMSCVLPQGKFNAAMSISVFEHLAMPWKVAIELNKIMATGGVGFIQTHQSQPLHDEPWDFWRISGNAWPALFNAATGFRVVEAATAEPVFMVAKRWHPIVNFGDAPGHAVSCAIIEKISETQLSWPVELSDVAIGNYPGA